MMRLKICGLKEAGNILEIAGLKPNYIGFIFYNKSKRYINNNLSEEFLDKLPPLLHKVGVFVNEEYENIVEKYNTYKLDYIQLHGDEQPDFCAKLLLKNITVIKAFSVGEEFDFSVLEPYVPFCKYFLFDTKGEQRGGTGKKFNWDILKAYPYQLPFFLSGGIGPEDAETIARLSLQKLHAIDINSKFEIEPGVKDIEKIKQFYTTFKSLNQPISC